MAQQAEGNAVEDVGGMNFQKGRFSMGTFSMGTLDTSFVYKYLSLKYIENDVAINFVIISHTKLLMNTYHNL